VTLGWTLSCKLYHTPEKNSAGGIVGGKAEEAKKKTIRSVELADGADKLTEPTRRDSYPRGGES